jgi:hypothetical protein
MDPTVNRVSLRVDFEKLYLKSKILSILNKDSEGKWKIFPESLEKPKKKLFSLLLQEETIRFLLLFVRRGSSI